MERIVDLSSDGLHAGIFRGFLTVSKGNQEVGRIALADIGGVIAHAHGLTWSNNALVKLADHNIPVVICAANHAPVSCLWPLEGHHMQGARLKAQLETGAPFKKQAWKQIIVAKIRMQAAILDSLGRQSQPFDLLARKVRSGDPGNIEAQAARRYWPQLMGSNFRRDRMSDGINAMLNYGYTVLRAMVSRSICGAGLHPSAGLHHSNQFNAFALADDLMEPYRPLVDRAVYNLIQNGEVEVSPNVKQALAALTTFDLETEEGMSPLFVQISSFVHSLAISYQSGKATLKLPKSPPDLVLSGLGKAG